MQTLSKSALKAVWGDAQCVRWETRRRKVELVPIISFREIAMRLVVKIVEELLLLAPLRLGFEGGEHGAIASQRDQLDLCKAFLVRDDVRCCGRSFAAQLIEIVAFRCEFGFDTDPEECTCFLIVAIIDTKLYVPFLSAVAQLYDLPVR